MHDALVVGAGIAGLAAAWELKSRGRAPLVLEGSSRSGGVITTDYDRGFVLDGGPDALLVQKAAGVDLCLELGIADRLVPTLLPRTAFVLKQGTLVPLPDASVLGLPTRLGALVASPLFTWRGKVRLAAEVMVGRSAIPDESIDAFMRRRFGAEAARYLGDALLAGIHAGDSRQLSMRALFPRLPNAEATHGSVLRAVFRGEGARRDADTPRQRAAGPRDPSWGAFVSFPLGLSELVSTLTRALGPGAVRHRAEVTAVSRGANGYALDIASGERLEARTVILTTPAPATARLIRGLDETLSDLCAAIPYASTATVLIGLPRDQVRHPLRGSGFVVPAAERRAVKAATWVTSKWPERAPPGTVLLRAFLGGATEPDVLEASDDALVTRALGELTEILGLTGSPLLTRVFRWPAGTPQYLVGHEALVSRIDGRLRDHPGLLMTGSGYRGTGIPDVIADARAMAARAVARM